MTSPITPPTEPPATADPSRDVPVADLGADVGSDERLSVLEARLAERAAAEGLLDVAYRTLDSPLGPLLLAATPHGVVRVAFEDEDQDAVLADLAERISPRVLAGPRRLDAAAGRLDAYFAGERRDVRVAVDLRLATGFRRAVIEALPSIGYGTTTTYGHLADRVGRPGAARAVGSACGSNPVPILVPCHRVVPASGGTGGYRGGPAAKAALLALESEHRDEN